MNSSRRQCGFALASGIFLLVILAALGAFIVNISTSQQIGAALDVQGERVYQASYAGMEWARYTLWNGATYPITPGANYCPGSANSWNTTTTTSLTFTSTQTLTGITATVECRRLDDTDISGVQTQVYEIRVTACNIPRAAEPKCPPADASAASPVPNPNSANLVYVERQISGLVSL